MIGIVILGCLVYLHLAAASVLAYRDHVRLRARSSRDAGKRWFE
jgi:hypothetical protein